MKDYVASGSTFSFLTMEMGMDSNLLSHSLISYFRQSGCDLVHAGRILVNYTDDSKVLLSTSHVHTCMCPPHTLGSSVSFPRTLAFALVREFMFWKVWPDGHLHGSLVSCHLGQTEFCLT